MALGGETQPLYRRVVHRLQGAIETGELRPGDRLPAERWLCEELSVSRGTVRRAVSDLVREGAVEVDGRVPRIARPPVGEPPSALMGFTEFGRSRNLATSARVLRHERRAATLDESVALGIAPGAPLIDLLRLRRLDGLAFSLDRNRVPADLLADAADTDFSRDSLYAVLDAAGEPPTLADYQIEARLPDAEERELLGLEDGAPVLCAITVLSGPRGRVIDLGRTVFRADRYRFGARLERRRHDDRREVA
jgi:DNA-binding GntR family transcriptional regulator